METTLTLFMEATDQRFVELREDMNKRFEQMMNTLQLIAGIFTALTLGVIGFAYLRKLAASDPPLANVLKAFHLW